MQKLEYLKELTEQLAVQDYYIPDVYLDDNEQLCIHGDISREQIKGNRELLESIEELALAGRTEEINELLENEVQTKIFETQNLIN